MAVVTVTLVVLIGGMAVSALVQNRGLHVEVNPNQIGLTLQPAEQPSPSISTYGDASPIITAPDAHVVTEAKGPNRQAPAYTSPKSGISTHGAASPIVTGQGAVVKSTVDTRP
ncbi:hypothetical protein [Pseudomonas sp. LB3P58]|jgi:hypothetical protein